MSNPKGQHAIAAARRVQSFDLRKSGLSYREIGQRLKISDAQAHRDVTRVLKRLQALVTEDATAMRIVELERLDAMTAVAWIALTSQDPGERLAAIDRMIRIQARRAALAGLDAPEKKDITSAGEAIKVVGIDLGQFTKENEPE